MHALAPSLNLASMAKALCNLILFQQKQAGTLTVMVDCCDSPAELAKHLLNVFQAADKLQALLEQLFAQLTAQALREQVDTVVVHVLRRLSLHGEDFLRLIIEPVLQLKNKSVKKKVGLLWKQLREQMDTLPAELKLVCQVLAQQPGSLQLVCGYFFLRFFNPFLVQYGEEAIQIAKQIQAISNGSGKTKRAKQIPSLFRFRGGLSLSRVEQSQESLEESVGYCSQLLEQHKQTTLRRVVSDTTVSPRTADMIMKPVKSKSFRHRSRRFPLPLW